MSLTEQIKAGFEDLQMLLSTTATFGSSEVDVIEGESNEVAELIMGGVEEEVTGVILVKKEDFSSLPEVGDLFEMDSKDCRVISLGTDQANPILTIGYNLGEVGDV